MADTLTAKVREVSARPTPTSRDHKDSPGMALEGVNPDGSHRDRTDLLPRKVYETERSGPPRTASGLPDLESRNGHGSRQESWEGQWPTPATRDHHAQGATHNPKAQSSSLATVIEKKPESWATPQSRDFRTSEGNEDRWENPERSRNLNDQTKAVQGSGKLNPSWVETLQGLPIGWTQLPFKFKKGRK